MGQDIEFPSNGTTGKGYLAGDSGPAVVVIQEWWGLDDHIRDVVDRFAAAGFVALGPDLYDGKVVRREEPDEAGKAMMTMNLDKAAKDMSGAVDEVRRRAGADKVGVVGFCMGGGLALLLGTQRPDAVGAVAPFYGVIPWPAAQPDWAAMTAAVQGHYAEHDDFANPESVRKLEAQLQDLGKDVEMFIYEGTQHAFFNDRRPDVHDSAAATQAWERVTDFFRARLAT